MKTLPKIFILAALLLVCAGRGAGLEIKDYFNSFYCNYLNLRGVNSSDRLVLDFLYEISNEKISTLQNELNNAKTIQEIRFLSGLIDEQYKDLVENLDFEISQVPNCPLKRKQIRKFKRAHKKFMRSLLKI